MVVCPCVMRAHMHKRLLSIREEGEEDEREEERREDACNLDRGHLLRATERGGV